MSLDQLDAPLRMTWDLCRDGEPVLAGDEALRVAERLVEAGLFYLLLDAQPLLHPQIAALVDKLAATGCRISLVLGRDPREFERLSEISADIDLLVDAAPWLDDPFDPQSLEAFLIRVKNRIAAPALLWMPRQGRLHLLPELFALCRRQALPRFKLPNYKIGANSGSVEAAGILQQKDLAELAALLKEHPADLGATALEVHDLFLWELLFPAGGGERSEYGGCQAGNSLGHIAANGELWPCSSWPLPLGSLLREDLHSLWDTPARHAVRAEVAADPADCNGCRDLPICYGGCRGLARTLRRDGDRRDLLCAGPRRNNAE